MQRKRECLIFAVLLGIIIFSFLVSAQSSTKETIDKAIETVKPVFDFALGGATSNDLLFIKFLIFIIVLSVVALVLNKVDIFQGNKVVVTVVAIAVALIAARYITELEVINFIVLPYTTLGVLLSTVIPFIIFFYFVESFDNPIFRKIGWIAFLCIFAGLAYTRYDTFYVSGSPWWKNLAILYAIIAILSFLAIIFDKKIRAMFFMAGMAKIEDKSKRDKARQLLAAIHDLQDKLASETDKEQIENLSTQIKDKKRALKTLMKT